MTVVNLKGLFVYSSLISSNKKNWFLVLKRTVVILSWVALKKNDILLKGKFSSGREGALASKFNYDFK